MYIEADGEGIRFLTRADPVLGAAIRSIGPVRRASEPDLFRGLVRIIVGQQISTAAQASVWARLTGTLGEVSPRSVSDAGAEGLRAAGTSLRKAEYILGIAEQVLSGTLDLDALSRQSDARVVGALTALKGVGIWTAEMMLLFCLKRPDIVSFSDLGIRRGMGLLYGEPAVTRAVFDRIRQRYSPHGTAASLYLWAIAGGAALPSTS